MNKGFKLPLQRSCIKVFTADYTMAFDFMFDMFDEMFGDKKLIILSEEQQDDIVAIINGTKKGKIEGIVEYCVGDGTIEVDRRVLLLIRGWGHLTGTGGLNLPMDEAAKLQDEFANYIVNKLSGKE